MTHRLQVERQRAEGIYTRRRLLVFLDYDGTLTPIAPTPAQAKLPRQAQRVLKRLSLSPGVLVGVISGRSLADVRRQVGLTRIIYAGNHGLEVKGLGVSFLHPQARRQQHTLFRLNRKLTQALRKVPGAMVEWKGLTASLHWRNVPQSAQRKFHRQMRELTTPYIQRGAIRLTRGKQVAEIRPRVDWDKGRVLEWLVQHLAKGSQLSATGVLYVGDDRTDEDAFKAVNCLGGLSVYVGHRGTRTAARYWLKDPREVQRWLADLCRIRARLSATEGGL